MKIVLTMFVIVGLTTSGLYAQMSGGLRAGLNLGSGEVSNDTESESFDGKVGFQAGGYFIANFNEHFAIQPELVYSHTRVTYMEADLDFGYIAVPLYLRYTINKMFNVHAGPQASFLMSAHAEMQGSGTDVKDYFTSTDLGASFGAGVDFGKFNAAFRYYISLSNIADDSYFPNDAKWKYNNFQLVVGYRLFGE